MFVMVKGGFGLLRYVYALRFYYFYFGTHFKPFTEQNVSTILFNKYPCFDHHIPYVFPTFTSFIYTHYQL